MCIQAAPVATLTSRSRPDVMSFALNNTNARQNKYTRKQVSAHCHDHDLWIIIEGCVYDVTQWQHQHPGGYIIVKFGGRDATEVFEAFHRGNSRFRLRKFLVGTIEETEDDDHSDMVTSDARTATTIGTEDPATKDLRQLRKRLWDEGYFKADMNYYNMKQVLWMSLVAISFCILSIFRNESYIMSFVVAPFFLGLGIWQSAFLGHDACHYMITKPKAGGSFNTYGWVMGTICMGISASMWNEEHSAHHAVTLRPCEDPQFNNFPVILRNKKELKSKYFNNSKQKSTSENDETHLKEMTRMDRFLVSIQHWLVPPVVLIVARFNFQLISVLFAVKRIATGVWWIMQSWLPMASIEKRSKSQRKAGAAKTTQAKRYIFEGCMDIIGMSLHFAWFSMTSIFFETGGWGWFVLNTYMIAAGLHFQLLSNHLGEETFTKEEEAKFNWFELQLRTTVNIDTKWYDAWLYGGLDYQIEHHLFPQMPRHNLSKVKPMVMDICKKHNLPYKSAPFSTVMSRIWHNLYDIALDVAALKMG